MPTARDIALKAVANAKKSNLVGFCQTYAGLCWEAAFGRPTPNSYPSAAAAYKASAIVSKDPAAAPPGAFHYFQYGSKGHVAFSHGHGIMSHASSNPSGRIGTLGKGVILTEVAKYDLPYLGWSYTNGNRPRIEGVTSEYAAPAASPASASAGNGGYTYTMIRGDGLTYQEVTGSWAARLQRGLIPHGYDTRTNAIDGIPGRNTRKALQRLARGHGYTGPIDGALGRNTFKALQRFAKARGGYTGPIDGVPGVNTWRGILTGLGV